MREILHIQGGQCGNQIAASQSHLKGTEHMQSFGRWCTWSMGSIQWVSALKMQICNWLEASEGRSRVALGSVLLIYCLSLDILSRSLTQSHCRAPLAPTCSTMVIGNYGLRFVCVWVWENEREGEVRETKKVLSIGIFLAKHSVLGFDFILWYCWAFGGAGYCVWKIRKCNNSKENKRKWDFF